MKRNEKTWEDIIKKVHDIEEQGDNWYDGEEEKIPGPNKKVLDFFKYTLLPDLNNAGLLPDRIHQTVDEGLFLKFTYYEEVMYLEIYNDGDAGYTTFDSETKDIILDKDVEWENIMKEILIFFNIVHRG